MKILALLVPVLLLFSLMFIMSKKHPAHVRMMWFGFSTMYVLSVAAFWLAHKFTWIDNDGKFVESGGHWFQKGADFLFDLGGEAELFAWIIAGIFAIHAVTYLGTMLAGCASSFKVVAHTFDFLTILFLKGFPGAAGFYFALLTCNAYFHWMNVELLQALAHISLATTLFALGFAILYMHMEKAALLAWLGDHMPPFIRRIHEWATRHNGPEQSFLLTVAGQEPGLMLLLARNGVRQEEFQADMAALIKAARSKDERNEEQLRQLCGKWDIAYDKTLMRETPEPAVA